jgi:hypothetical protein
MHSLTSDTGSFDLRYDAWGRLVLTDAEGVRHVGVEAVRSFPISDPDRWIALCDGEGREVVSVPSLAALPASVREILEQELARREFVPVIRRILSVPEESEPAQWEVETDRGRTSFLVNTGDDVRRLGPHRALVIDTQGVRYMIDDTNQLDAVSRRILERYL